jgi:hypothetical protein
MVDIVLRIRTAGWCTARLSGSIAWTSEGPGVGMNVLFRFQT